VKSDEIADSSKATRPLSNEKAMRCSVDTERCELAASESPVGNAYSRSWSRHYKIGPTAERSRRAQKMDGYPSRVGEVLRQMKA
jgi:hypothetical protein